MAMLTERTNPSHWSAISDHFTPSLKPKPALALVRNIGGWLVLVPCLSGPGGFDRALHDARIKGINACKDARAWVSLFCLLSGFASPCLPGSPVTLFFNLWHSWLSRWLLSSPSPFWGLIH
jgi:hypothetical protein